MQLRQFSITCAMGVLLMMRGSRGQNFQSSDSIVANSPRDGWSYEDVNEWPEEFPLCDGTHQSPINIDRGQTQLMEYGPFTFHDYDVFPPIETITDNGHTLVAEQNDDLIATVQGGGLSSEYRLKQFHFHWGSVNSQGSEHTVDGFSYPMEMHLVHYNTIYGSVSNATLHSDGLMVLGVFFEISEFDNPALEPLIQKAATLVNSNQSEDVENQSPFISLLPEDTTQFYRYSGSLTTPECNEAVTWTIFRQTAGVSLSQLEVLRHLVDSHGELLHDNFRPTQPLNDRQVCQSFVQQETNIFSWYYFNSGPWYHHW